jgi:hypothetical protein
VRLWLRSSQLGCVAYPKKGKNGKNGKKGKKAKTVKGRFHLNASFLQTITDKNC